MKESRDARFSVVVTLKEFAKLKRFTESKGMTISSYVRHVILEDMKNDRRRSAL